MLVTLVDVFKKKCNISGVKKSKPLEQSIFF